jgi:similar to nter part of tr
MTQLPSCIDYITSIETPQLLKAKELQGGAVVLKNGKPLRYAGGFCVVFPFRLKNNRKVAVRCWIAHVSDADKRSHQISEQLKNSGLPYFVGFEYIPQGIATPLGVFPIVIMDWIEAMPLKEYLKNNLNAPNRLINLANQFLQMSKDLHSVGFSHGDLQHGNIMVNSEGKLFLVDYDSMFVPGLENVSDEIKGLSGYQHPGRNKQIWLSPKSDYFSELIIYTSILAIAYHPCLWNELEIEDTETLVFSQDDLDYPNRSSIITRLKKDSVLSDCIDAIESALRETDIEKLLPLEKAIVSASTRLVEELQEKWKTRPQPVREQKPVDIGGLKSKWKKRQEVAHEPDGVASITSKWKS